MADNLLWHKNSKVYMVTSVEDDTIHCNELFLDDLRSEYIGIPLPWSMVGVHKYKGTSGTTTTIQRSDVVGKVMKCGQILYKWMPEWVMSKVDY